MVQILILTVLLSPLATAVSHTPLQGSSKPNFTGIWNARIIKTADGSTPREVLSISFNDPKLKVSRILSRQNSPLVMGQLMPSQSSVNFVYYTDGRGETHTNMFSGDSTKSKTQRVGEQFVITSSSSFKKSGRKITTEMTLTFEVAGDGKTLSEKKTSVTDGESRQTAQLYDRVEGTNQKGISSLWAKRVENYIISLEIEHHDPEIKVTRRVISKTSEERSSFTFYTDGRGEKNGNDGQLKSVTKWEKNSLVIESSSSVDVGRDEFSFSEKKKWQLEKGGASLVEVLQSSTSTKPGFVLDGNKETRFVYARSSQPVPGGQN